MNLNTQRNYYIVMDAMAVDGRGNLIDDFRIEESPSAIHVLNAPSPAATSSLMIGKYIAGKAELRINAD